jgi:hypothetical protein
MKNNYFLFVLIAILFFLLLKNHSPFGAVYTVLPDLNYNLTLKDSQNTPLPKPIVEPPLAKGQNRIVDIKSYTPDNNYTINYTNSPSTAILTQSQDIDDSIFLSEFKFNNKSCITEADAAQRGYIKTGTQPGSQIFAQNLCNRLGFPPNIIIAGSCLKGSKSGNTYSCLTSFPVTINIPTNTFAITFTQYDSSNKQITTSTLKNGTNSVNMSLNGYFIVSIKDTNGTTFSFYFGNNNGSNFTWTNNTITQTSNVISSSVFMFSITLNVKISVIRKFATWRIYTPNPYILKSDGVIDSNQTFKKNILLGDVLGLNYMDGTKQISPEFKFPGTYNVSF